MKLNNEICVSFLRGSGWIQNHDEKVKNEIIDKSQKVVDTINKQYRRGLITDRERYEKVCEV